MSEARAFADDSPEAIGHMRLPMTGRICRAAGLAFVVALGIACSEGDERRSDSTAGVEPAGARASATAPWYRRAVARDLNGDGRADSAVLAAVGRRSDSLSISLTMFVDGLEAYTERWESSYELVDVADSLLVPPRRDDYVRTRLDSALASDRVEPLDTANARLMGEGTSALDTVRPPPDVQLTLSYGYESSVALAWHAPTHRFAILWACC